MKAWEVLKGSAGAEGLRRAERPQPEPGWHQVLIRVRAVSLNYRDHLVVIGQYIGGAVTRDTIPCSDGAGEVVAVAPGLPDRVGDRSGGARSFR